MRNMTSSVDNWRELCTEKQIDIENQAQRIRALEHALKCALRRLEERGEPMHLWAQERGLVR